MWNSTYFAKGVPLFQDAGTTPFNNWSCFHCNSQKIANHPVAYLALQLPDDRGHAFLNSLKNSHSGVLPLQLEGWTLHWSPGKHLINMNSAATAHPRCAAQSSPSGTALLIWTQDFWNLFYTFKRVFFFVLLVQMCRGKGQPVSAKKRPRNQKRKAPL